jgi:cell pole-organizing protein PopZ
MNSPNPQHEPTMEEILASIRKIISEDQPEPAKPAPMPPQPVAEAPLPPDPDVLELTEEVRDERQAPVIANDVVFEAIEEQKAEPMDNDDLISDSTRDALDRAFANFDDNKPARIAPVGGSLESLFTHAVQDAFSPTLSEWVEAHHGEIMDELRPMIRDWMDENLPQLIEAAVAREMSRISPRRR